MGGRPTVRPPNRPTSSVERYGDHDTYVEEAIEGCNGVGKHLAQRLVAEHERVVDGASGARRRALDFCGCDDLLHRLQRVGAAR